jgi:hypothetical protein
VLFIVGGVAGIQAARLFAGNKRVLSLIFAGLVIAVGVHVAVTALMR